MSSALTMLTPTEAHASVGRWFRVLLPDATMRGKIESVSEDGNVLTVSRCPFSKLHLDSIDVWVENDD